MTFSLPAAVDLPAAGLYLFLGASCEDFCFPLELVDVFQSLLL